MTNVARNRKRLIITLVLVAAVFAAAMMISPPASAEPVVDCTHVATSTGSRTDCVRTSDAYYNDFGKLCVKIEHTIETATDIYYPSGFIGSGQRLILHHDEVVICD